MSGSESTEPDMSAPTPASTPTTAAHTALDMAAASVTTASDPSTPAASVTTPSTTTASTTTPSTPPTDTAVRTAREPLRTRDVILIGVYAAVYLVLISIPAAPAHLIPSLMPFMGLGCGVFGSIVYLLAVTKSRRFGTATIMGVLLALLMGVIHGNYFTVITALASSVAADLTAGYGKYRGTGTLLASSGIFNLWTVGMALPYMLTRQRIGGITDGPASPAWIRGRPSPMRPSSVWCVSRWPEAIRRRWESAGAYWRCRSASSWPLMDGGAF